MCFCLLYKIYNTPVGRWMHNRELAQVRASGVHPHCKWTFEEETPVYKIGDLTIVALPYLADNLAYVIYSTSTDLSKEVRHLKFLVDPGDFEMVMEFLARYDIQGPPEAILSTHKHHDHAGNNNMFAEHWRGV
jgi:Zn-finger protein